MASLFKQSHTSCFKRRRNDEKRNLVSKRSLISDFQRRSDLPISSQQRRRRKKSPKQNKITTKNGIEKAKDKSKNKESKRRRRISRMGSVKSESVSEPSSQWRRLRRGFRASVCCFVRCSFTETLTHTLQSNVLSDGVDGADDRPRLHKRKKERNTLKH